MDRLRLPVESCGASGQAGFNAIRKAIAAGFFNHACRKDPQEGFRSIADNQQVYIHPSSALFNRNPEWVIYHELVMTTKEYMREVLAIEPKWLLEVAPKYFKQVDEKSISKRKRQERLEPLHNRYEDPNAWRLSRRRG
jgi:ATP-dependent RNA helicase DHX8/PRP22